MKTKEEIVNILKKELPFLKEKYGVKKNWDIWFIFKRETGCKK